MHISFKKSVVFLGLIYFNAICLQVNYARSPGINSGKDAKVSNGTLFGGDDNIRSKNAGHSKRVRVKRNATGGTGSGGSEGGGGLVVTQTPIINETSTAAPTGTSPGNLSISTTELTDPSTTPTSTTISTTTTTTTKPDIQNTTFGKLVNDGQTIDYDSLKNGIWEIKNTRKMVITCPSKIPSNQGKSEEITLKGKTNMHESWNGLREVVNSESNKNNLEYEIDIGNNATKAIDKDYFSFVGYYKCEYAYNSGPETQFTTQLVTPILRIILGKVNFKVNVDVKLKKKTKIGCPDLNGIGMSEKSQIYFYNAYDNKDEKSVHYVALPNNAIRGYQNSTVLIKKLQPQNLGHYYCLYAAPGKQDFQIIYNVYSSQYNNIKVDVTHFYVISAFTLLSTIIIFVPLFFR
uniref:Sporozoite surface protein P36p n=1 Tax=Strongyloides venezuelensis TaxID=75913 RepID=A0A0K0G0U4_STRVS